MDNIDAVNELPKSSNKNALAARIATYLGWAIVLYKTIEPIYFSYVYINVISIEYITYNLAAKASPWIFIGITFIQAGRWVKRGDSIHSSAGKLLQILGLGAIVFMLTFFIPDYIKTASDMSIAIYTIFHIVIGCAILITGLSLIILGALLKRQASKASLISASIISVIMIFISLRMLY